MFNFSFHPYMRWLRGRPQGDGSSFDQDGLPLQTPAQRTLSFPPPRSDALVPSSPITALASFGGEPAEFPGFRVGLRDDVPGFNLNESGVPEGMPESVPGILTPRKHCRSRQMWRTRLSQLRWRFPTGSRNC
jgi:hypothetical protein